MGLILQGVLFCVKAFLSRQIAEEFKEWTPSIVKRLIQHATEQFPEVHRERYAEEWEREVDDIPGHIGKVYRAVGFLIAAQKMSSILAGSNPIYQLRNQKIIILRWGGGTLLVASFIVLIVEATEMATVLIEYMHNSLIRAPLFYDLYVSTMMKHHFLWGVLQYFNPKPLSSLDNLIHFFWLVLSGYPLVVFGRKLFEKAESLHRIDSE